MQKTLDQKLAAIHADPHGSNAFILADAKDADMGFGITAPGPSHSPGRSPYKSLEDYRAQIRAIIEQGLVDVMLLSASNIEQLAMKEKLFRHSKVTPAARANDTTDIWIVRNSRYPGQLSRPFRSATIDHIKYGKLVDDYRAPHVGADLGLYSITFTNDVELDLRALEKFREFRLEAEKKRFRYFLEVFNPQPAAEIAAADVGVFLNDHIIRALAGVTSAGRPLFLKIPYNGPAALEEMAAYDPHLIVGILGGAAGTTLDAFQLLHDAKAHGARVALFGRKINLSEHPLLFVEMLHAIANGKLAPKEAVKLYHDGLAKARIKPARPIKDDLALTQFNLSYGSAQKRSGTKRR